MPRLCDSQRTDILIKIFGGDSPSIVGYWLGHLPSVLLSSTPLCARKIMVMWWLLLFIPVCFGAPVPEKFTLSVPDGPITVRIGSSVILPCSLSPAFTESLQVRWHRPDKYKTPVLLYDKQQIQEQPADPQYRGRVTLIGELEKGNVSLKLDKVAVEDKGEFICFVAGNKWYEQASVQLIVKALGSPPVLSVNDGGSGQVNVTCKSHGWYPQPTLTWRNNEGSEIPSQSLYSVIGAHGFVSVTSWLLYSSSDSEWIACTVGLSEVERKESRILPYMFWTDTVKLQSKLMDKDAEIESLKQKSEELEERLKKESTGPWKELIISFIVLLLLAGIVVFILYKKGFIKYKDIEKASAVTQQDKSQASEGETENLLKSEDLENWKQKYAEQQSALDETKGELEKLKEQTEEVKVLEERLTTSGAEVERLKKETIELQSQVNGSTGGMETLKQQIKACEDDRNTLDGKVKRLEQENQKLKQQNEELQSQVNGSTGELETLKQQIKACEDDRNTLDGKVKRLEQENQKLEQQNEELQSQVNGSMGGMETPKQQIKDGFPQKHVLALPTWDRVKDFKECPTMDSASVKGDLRIRREGKSVDCTKPNNSQMLDTSCYVLCKDTFNSGQHYWEVKIGDKAQSVKQSWFVGVCSDTLRGQSGVSLDSRNDCWLLCYYQEDGLFVNTNPVTPVQFTTPLNRLGVFLDCSAHSLIFYDAESQLCLCTFCDMNTTHPLVPVLGPGVRDKCAMLLINEEQKK